MEAAQEAAELLERHGRRAQQLVVNQIVAAVRNGDDPEATHRSAVLSAIDAAIQASARRSADTPG